jgi:rhamnulokinase
MSAPGRYLAVDLGAASGRVMLARVGPSTLELTEARRFPNVPVSLPDGLHWDVLRLYRDVLDGLTIAAGGGQEIASVGVDAWGVDYGLLDAWGALVGNPYNYRDDRTAGVAERVHARCRGTSCTDGPASSSCHSTPSTNSPPTRPRDGSTPPGACCWSPT